MTTPADAGLLSPFSYGRGYQTLKDVADPAAGAAATLLVPGSRQYRLLSAQWLVTTSATVANREARIRFLDGDQNEWLRSPAGAFITASSAITVQAFFGIGQANTSAAFTLLMPSPDIFIPAGHTIEFGAGLLQNNDTITNVKVFVEEFPIGPRAYPVGVQPAFPPQVQ